MNRRMCCSQTDRAEDKVSCSYPSDDPVIRADQRSDQDQESLILILLTSNHHRIYRNPSQAIICSVALPCCSAALRSSIGCGGCLSVGVSHSNPPRSCCVWPWPTRLEGTTTSLWPWTVADVAPEPLRLGQSVKSRCACAQRLWVCIGLFEDIFSFLPCLSVGPSHSMTVLDVSARRCDKAAACCTGDGMVGHTRSQTQVSLESTRCV